VFSRTHNGFVPLASGEHTLRMDLDSDTVRRLAIQLTGDWKVSLTVKYKLSRVNDVLVPHPPAGSRKVAWNPPSEQPSPLQEPLLRPTHTLASIPETSLQSP
jgi:hypothetical protein